MSSQVPRVRQGWLDSRLQPLHRCRLACSLNLGPADRLLSPPCFDQLDQWPGDVQLEALVLEAGQKGYLWRHNISCSYGTERERERNLLSESITVDRQVPSSIPLLVKSMRDVASLSRR